MKYALAVAAMLMVTGSAMARGPESRLLPNGNGRPVAVQVASEDKKPATTRPADTKTCPHCTGEQKQHTDCSKC